MMIQLPKLLDGNSEVRRIRPVNVSINENLVPLSTASLTILKEDLFPERSYVELFTANGSAGIFRARAPEVGYGSNSIQVTLEHGICEIGDYIVRENEDSTQKTLAAAIQHYFSFYGGTRWQLGTVSVSGNVVVSSEYQNVLSAILNAIQQLPDAMMAFDFSTTPWTVSVRPRGSVVEAEGRLSRNILSANVKRDDSSLATRVWLEGLGGAGVIGHMDADTISTYGVIEVSLSGRNYTQQQATTVAGAYLERHKRPIYSITIDGADLSGITGETLDRMALGKKYRLAIPEDGVVLEETITAIRWPNVYDNPGKCTVYLAEPPETAVTFLQGRAASVASSIGGLSGSVSAMGNKLADTQEDVDWIWQKTGINDLGQSETLTTRIQVNAEAIQTEVSRATNAENSKISKTSDYATVDSILNRAKTLASNAETNAKNASIAKTSTYQSADAIYQAAIRQAASDAGNTYISKTLRYQTADAIVDAAESYVDYQLQSYSTVTQTSNAIQAAVNLLEQADADMDAKISLVVTRSGSTDVINTASIIAGINSAAQGGGSYIKLQADTIDVDGVVQGTEAKLNSLMTGQSVARWVTAETLHVQQHFQFGPDGQEARFGPTNITVGGTTYTVLAVVQ